MSITKSPMAITQVITVTQVCADHNSYLKIGPNRKKMYLGCRARQALFAIITTTIFETPILRLRRNRRGRTLTTPTLLTNTRANTHTQLQKTQ